MEFTDTERATQLRALFELWITQSAFDDEPDQKLIPIVATIPRASRSWRWCRSSAATRTRQCSERICNAPRVLVVLNIYSCTVRAR